VLSGPKEEGGTLVTFLKPDVEPHDDASRVVGRRTTYHGEEHPYLRGHTVIVVALLEGALENEEYGYLQDDEAIRAAGGVGPRDRVEVTPWLEQKGRVSFVTSDPRATDLACFADLGTERTGGETREGRTVWSSNAKLIAPNLPSQRRND